VRLGLAIGGFAAIVTLTFRAIAKDQKVIWSFPVAAVRGDAWKPALGVIGTTAALVALDPVSAPWLQRPAFQDTPAMRRINRVLSGRNMAMAINAAPLSFFLGGLARGSSFAGQTGLLAGEAAASAEIVAMTMKHLDRRMRPIEVGPEGNFTRTWFRTKSRDIDGAGCFPSGHTAAAFAIASVVAARYRGAAWGAYGMAGIVGASRLTSRAHFPSDVFLGAALGYSIGRFVVVPRSLAPMPPKR